MKENTIPYWMAFAHAKDFTNRRKMDFLLQLVHEKDTLENVVKKIKGGEKPDFDFTDKEWKGLQDAIGEIPNHSFLAEKLLNEGVDIIHVMEKYMYPRVLKDNLKKNAPIVIYTKGNPDLLNRNSIAIVGSRKCTDTSLEFTRNMARKGVQKKDVIVSGFAKGVDKQALDAALKAKGQSIIVLPQGIDTYRNKTYYPYIVKGDVLVISTYHPKWPWSVGLAMDRNKTIYGLAREIYVAESGTSGGTWEGAKEGLKRGMKVYVRKASEQERNANNILIRNGAIPVDLNGNELSREHIKSNVLFEKEEPYETQELSNEEMLNRTISLLKTANGKGFKLTEIAENLQLDEKSRKKLGRILNASPDLLKEKKGRYNFYYLKSAKPIQGSIF